MSRRTRTTLILGASYGIGLGTVKQYRTGDWRAIITVRMQEAAHALQALGAEAHVLDLTDANAVAGLAWKFDGKALDVVIYVAGIYGPCTQDATPVGQADLDAVIHTNVWASVDVLPIMLPMVKVGRNDADEPGGIPAVISSCMGSIGDIAGNGGRLYHAGRAMVNAASRGVSIDTKNATCLTFHPGWVQTNIDGVDAAITPQESVAGIRRVIADVTRADNGGLRNYDGSVIEW